MSLRSVASSNVCAIRYNKVMVISATVEID
jgi:hypothetical protein